MTQTRKQLEFTEEASGVLLSQPVAIEGINLHSKLFIK